MKRAALGFVAITLLCVAPLAAQSARIPDLGGAIAWLYSPPLNMDDLRGKVVLVDFWEYSC
ncbi:MAG: cytochrome c biogenesis protein, partial [Candidatus Eremiobacteraeota bacterium]|nr:cytochrome c biogenesis protein [Candidatus Eremiobacteraeota bacterium]